MESDTVIFLTGATGLLGGEILRSVLVAEPSASVIVLVRGDPARYDNLIDDTLRAEFANRVEPVWGDLEKPGLGLDGRAQQQSLNASPMSFMRPPRSTLPCRTQRLTR